MRVRLRPIHPCLCLRLFIHRAEHAGQNAFRPLLCGPGPASWRDQLHDSRTSYWPKGQAKTLSDRWISLRSTV
ncbi:hypothetical protein XspCFBP7912_15760 [Xanthomonas sp. CFBP 7912]|nr:hypothetical protein XspCFBP7912_15760 [Xanthomonas sp. CFBP 7912]RJS04211.1 hypothetical protein XnspCFBP7698_10880 [Xanthomonas sp. CFBP 7698]